MPGLLEGWDVSLPSLLIFICVTPSYFPLFLFNPLPYSTLTLLISTLYQCNVSIVNSSFFKRPVENSSKSSSLTTKLRTWWSAVQDANFFCCWPSWSCRAWEVTWWAWLTILLTYWSTCYYYWPVHQQISLLWFVCLFFIFPTLKLASTVSRSWIVLFSCSILSFHPEFWS